LYEVSNGCQGWRNIGLTHSRGLYLKTNGIVFDKNPQVFSRLKIELTPQDLARQIKTSGNRPEILRAAQTTLDKVENTWNPSVLCCWCEVGPGNTNTIGTIQSSGNVVNIDFGYSFKFLKHATHVLVSVYTAGNELDNESKKASGKGDFLEAFFIDHIGLIVLEKTGDFIKRIAEKKATELGWGVSPFLSPGSVHGWELAEQKKLCSLLPLEKINVNIREDAMLSPFKTISCLIGLGPGYDTVKVGTTCQVCSKNHDCQMKHDEN
jgi:hypothetical protein